MELLASTSFHSGIRHLDVFDANHSALSNTEAMIGEELLCGQANVRIHMIYAPIQCRAKYVMHQCRPNTTPGK